MLKLKNTSIKYSYVLTIVLIIFPVMTSCYLITSNSIKTSINRSAQIAVDQSKNSIIESMKFTEKNYELVSSYYDSVMKEGLESFGQAYDENDMDPSKIDLQKLKEAYNGIMDFYVIDENGVIIHSTFQKVLGLDFKDTPKVYKELTKIRIGGEIEISNVTAERRTQQLRKWAYMPTSDHKYLLEVGVSSEELKRYINEFDYVGIAKQLKNNNPFIRDVYVYDRNHFKLGYNELEKDEEKIKLLDRVTKNEKDYKIYGSKGFVERDYVYVNTFKGSNIEDSEKVIEIIYDYSVAALEFEEMKRAILSVMLIYAFASFMLIMFLTARYVANPLVNLAGKMENVSWNNLNVEVEYDGENEIGVLSRSFAEMAGKLSDTIISKKYLENIIDSVGDVFMVLDKEFNVKRVNEYTMNLLGYEKTEFLDKPIEKLFGGSFSREEVIGRLKESNTAENIENVLKKSDGCEIIVLSSFSALYDENMDIIGYACNSKDISKTKETLSKLEHMNIKLRESESKLIEKSTKDHLTGISNRGHIFGILKEVAKNIPNEYKSLSVVMCDADHFKSINDDYGHQIGDQVLTKIAETIKSSLRKGDHVGRYGGEEFLVILPNADKDNAVLVAERIRKDVENTLFHDGKIRMTISGGVAQYNTDGDYKEMIKRADDLLYKAKREGRNRIER
ncbi:PAS domain S-box-containing protein/diguanylate cyclase (GGDEF) domain-containing protein [Peptoclostridium litorale DSM 5388]|uniref:Diguanylate cyclase/phosphodiesterase n=1 Tax=Peptoclostridium litorale DSM 5388 TaxID=1121324 RepID=A0A069RMW8_PEPLI|nr:diguanylate cyclase [Peptoclostridium litorale]KDR95527.1 diguanylate cyclase/phosphodiesterase [Peptoclostridium litorale DSM 5388]SIO16777.1 PAS domain S-box-containing protein/diguanylate cyclase (GGDEF) domain-containing protein [Peptoclostridium litorale DSM 5388]